MKKDCYVLCFRSPLETSILGVYTNYKKAKRAMAESIIIKESFLLHKGHRYTTNTQCEDEWEIYVHDSNFYYMWRIVKKEIS